MKSSNLFKMSALLCCCWFTSVSAANPPSVCNAYSGPVLNSICKSYCDTLDCDNVQHSPSLNLQCISYWFKWQLASNGSAIPCPSDAIMAAATVSNNGGPSSQTISASLNDPLTYSITILNQGKRLVNVTSITNNFNNSSPTTSINCSFSPALPGWLKPGTAATCTFSHTVGNGDGAVAGGVFTNTVLAKGQYILGQKVAPTSATTVVNVNNVTVACPDEFKNALLAIKASPGLGSGTCVYDAAADFLNYSVGGLPGAFDQLSITVQNANNPENAGSVQNSIISIVTTSNESSPIQVYGLLDATKSQRDACQVYMVQQISQCSSYNPNAGLCGAGPSVGLPCAADADCGVAGVCQ